MYSVTGLEGGNLEKPKKKRGRPSKAEKEAMLTQSEIEEDTAAEEIMPTNEIKEKENNDNVAEKSLEGVGNINGSDLFVHGEDNIVGTDDEFCPLKAIKINIEQKPFV